jgi:flagellar biosynthetic protein FliR
VRAALAVGLATMVTPLQAGAGIDSPGNLLHFLVYVGGEALVGVVLGLGTLLLFTGIQIAGQIVGQMSGLHLADAFDPLTQTNTPVCSRLLNMLALAAFVIIGGHRVLVDALLDTFRWMPPGHALVHSGVIETLVGVMGQSFELGVRAAAPTMVALLLAVLVMGLISRTLPQLNMLAVGLGLNSMIMLAMLAVTMGTMVWLFQDQVIPTIDNLKQALRAAT